MLGITIIAHRGNGPTSLLAGNGGRVPQQFAPENTLKAFQRALDQGADGIEFDLYVTKDGHPVVIHDNELNINVEGAARSQRDLGNISEQTLEEVQRYDVGQKQKIPSLRETLDFFVSANAKRASKGHPPLIANIELKGKSIHEPVVDVIREYTVGGRLNTQDIIFCSFDHKQLAALKIQNPDLQIAPSIKTATLFGDDNIEMPGWKVKAGASYSQAGLEYLQDFHRNTPCVAMDAVLWDIKNPLVELSKRNGIAIHAATSDFRTIHESNKAFLTFLHRMSGEVPVFFKTDEPAKTRTALEAIRNELQRVDLSKVTVVDMHTLSRIVYGPKNAIITPPPKPRPYSAVANEESIKEPVQAITNRLELISTVKSNEVWHLHDPATGKQYYAKLADAEQQAMTIKASQFRLNDEAILQTPEVLVAAPATTPPSLQGKVPSGDAKKSLLIVEAVPKSASLGNLICYGGQGIPNELKCQPITAGEFDRFLQTVQFLNKHDIFNHDLESNTEVHRGKDGNLIIYSYDYEPHALPARHSALEDYAQMIAAGKKMLKTGALEPDAKAVLERHEAKLHKAQADGHQHGETDVRERRGLEYETARQVSRAVADGTSHFGATAALPQSDVRAQTQAKAAKAYGAAGLLNRAMALRDYNANTADGISLAMDTADFVSNSRGAKQLGVGGNLVGVVADTIRGYEQNGAVGAAKEGGKSLARADAALRVTTGKGLGTALAEFKDVSKTLGTAITNAKALKPTVLIPQAVAAAKQARDMATLANIANSAKSLAQGTPKFALQAGAINAAATGISEIADYVTGDQELNRHRVSRSVMDTAVNFDPIKGMASTVGLLNHIGIATHGAEKASISKGVDLLMGGKGEEIGDIAKETLNIYDKEKTRFQSAEIDSSLRYKDAADPAKPLMTDYKHLSFVSSRLAKHLPDGKIESHDIRTEFNQIDFSKAENAEAYKSALNQAIKEQERLMAKHDNGMRWIVSSWIPFSRSEQDAHKFDEAENEHGLLKAAMGDLEKFKARAGTYNEQKAQLAAEKEKREAERRGLSGGQHLADASPIAPQTTAINQPQIPTQQRF